MSVQEYLDKHDITKRVEEVINACVKAKPDEPISYMVHMAAQSNLLNVYSRTVRPCTLTVD